VIAVSTFAKTGIVAGIVAVAVGLESHGGATPPPVRVAGQSGTPARVGLDAASDAQARRMRRVTVALGAELSAAARCATAECALPALRHAGIGGHTNSMLVRVVMAGVPASRCRDYLFGLQAANDGASDAGHWLLPKLYERGTQQREITTQLALAGQMLRHAALVAPADVCAPGADGPAG
jgi:hypothetical protein